MIIGNFIYDSQRDVYRGEIATLTVQRGSIILRPTDKVGDREPDYRIVQEREGGVVELGAAWKRSSEKGRSFLSVMLDDPALPGALNAALFPSDRGERAHAGVAAAHKGGRGRGGTRATAPRWYVPRTASGIAIGPEFVTGPGGNPPRSPSNPKGAFGVPERKLRFTSATVSMGIPCLSHLA
jgi:uncharacterized protein (DUF736 family)